MLKTLRIIKRWLRPAPSLREAHRRYQDHRQPDGTVDLIAANLTAVEYIALRLVLEQSPSADRYVYDVTTAIKRLSPWCPLLAGIMPLFDPSLLSRVKQLLERWEKQEEEAERRLKMPPGVRHPFFGSPTHPF